MARMPVIAAASPKIESRSYFGVNSDFEHFGHCNSMQVVEFDQRFLGVAKYSAFGTTGKV